MSNEKLNYFEAYERQAGYCQEAIQCLKQQLKGNTFLDPKQGIDTMHVIENEADSVTHEIEKALLNDFIVPFDRDVMVLLSGRLDDVVDAVEDIALSLYVFHVKNVDGHFMDMLVLLEKAAKELASAVQFLGQRGKKYKDIQEHLIRVNEIETMCDGLYLNACYNLYEETNVLTDGARRITHELYYKVEYSMDCIEKAAEEIEAMLLANL